jgi:thymidylate kinase
MAYIISLMGIDGSGKSSLGRLLCRELNQQGQPAVFVWAALRPVLMRPFIKIAKFLLVRKHNKFKDYEKHMEVKAAGMKKLRWTHGIYFLVMMLDYLPQVFYKVLLPHLLGKHVICDRYYHDLMLDYCAHINAPVERALQLTYTVGKFLPRPDLVYMVTVPPDVAMQRKDDIPSLGYLSKRIYVYEKINTLVHGATLDGTLPLEQNCDLICNDMERI